jgi:hypothetical protein
MEQPSADKGLDHHGRDMAGPLAGEAVAVVGKGTGARHDAYVSCNRSPAKAADTIRDPCWQCSEVLGGPINEYEPGGTKIDSGNCSPEAMNAGSYGPLQAQVAKLRRFLYGLSDPDGVDEIQLGHRRTI